MRGRGCRSASELSLPEGLERARGVPDVHPGADRTSAALGVIGCTAFLAASMASLNSRAPSSGIIT